MKRVETDNARNNRIPKSATVGYTMVPGGPWIAHTFRLPFPTDKDFNSRVQRLVDSTRKSLRDTGHSSFIRIGFSAIDFVHRPKVGIDSFFSKDKTQPTISSKRLVSGANHVRKETNSKSGDIGFFFSARKKQPATPKSKTTTSPQLVGHVDNELHNDIPSCKPNQKQDGSELLHLKGKGTDVRNWLADDSTVSKTNSLHASQHTHIMTDEEIARQLQNSYDNETRKESKHNDEFSDKDKAFAFQLQSSYDREHSVLTHVERFSGTKNNNSNTKSHSKGNSSKRSKIDFFLKK